LHQSRLASFIKKQKQLQNQGSAACLGVRRLPGVLGAALLCAIHGATVENTIFEDGDGANTFRAFNPTQSEARPVP
jgi:hypothetical protein